MLRRRFMTKGARLPAAYQEVEYLQSSGTQWIDTGVAGSNNIGYVFDYMPLNVSTEKAIFGEGQGNARCCFHIGGRWYPYWGASQNTTGAVANTRYVLSYNAQNDRAFKVDGTSKLTFSGSPSVGSNTAWLFNVNNPTWGTGYGASMRLYSCQMYDGSTMVRDFVPCYRKSDNVAGLYDLVNKVFYTNAGSGSFTVGGNV